MLDSYQQPCPAFVCIDPQPSRRCRRTHWLSRLTQTAPDAIDNLKRALKGLFKRGKKSKTTTPTSTTPTQPPQPSAGGSAAAAAPQLPPIQNASPLQSATDTSKPLPPTHPLAIGPLDKPVETVPPNRDAQPGPPAPVVGPAETADQVQEQQKDSEIPVTLSQPSSAVDGVRSGDGSVVTNGASPQSPPKTDGAVEEFKTGEPAGMHDNSCTRST